VIGMFCEKIVSKCRDWHVLRDHRVFFRQRHVLWDALSKNLSIARARFFSQKAYLYIPCQKTIFVYIKKQFFSKIFFFWRFSVMMHIIYT